MTRARVVVLVLVGLGAAGAVLLRPSRVVPAEVQAAARAGLPRLVELGSTSCASCKAMHEELARLREECGSSLAVEELDVWREDDAARRYRVSVIPTQVFLDTSGREVDRHVGFLARAEIRERFSRHGAPCRP